MEESVRVEKSGSVEKSSIAEKSVSAENNVSVETSKNMKKGNVDLIAYMKEAFYLPAVDVDRYSPLALAYIGDGVYELIIRTILVEQGNTKAGKLHKRASALVKASAQSAMMEVLKPLLTDQEMAVYKRGRNAKSPTMAKNATVADYRRATGFEALIGWLYLNGEYKRMVDLVKAGLKEVA